MNLPINCTIMGNQIHFLYSFVSCRHRMTILLTVAFLALCVLLSLPELNEINETFETGGVSEGAGWREGLPRPLEIASRIEREWSKFIKDQNKRTTQIFQGEVCSPYHEAAYRPRLVVRDILNCSHLAVDERSVTLSSQLSGDRIDNLLTSLHHWSGPVSVSLYCQLDSLLYTMRRLLTSELLQTRTNVIIHVIPAQGNIYPVNMLRNIALKAVRTEYVLLTDIDLMPSEGLIRSTRWLQDQENTVLVIPAFEEATLQTDFRESFPSSKQHLHSLFKQGYVKPFLLDVWKRSHTGTDYDRWWNASLPYKVDMSKAYEPYILARTTSLPYFCEKFVGRYKDKAQHIAEINAMGFDLIVVPDAFLLHLWHAPSDQYNALLKKCSRFEMERFTEYLRQTYNCDNIWTTSCRVNPDTG